MSWSTGSASSSRAPRRRRPGPGRPVQRADQAPDHRRARGIRSRHQRCQHHRPANRRSDRRGRFRDPLPQPNLARRTPRTPGFTTCRTCPSNGCRPKATESKARSWTRCCSPYRPTLCRRRCRVRWVLQRMAGMQGFVSWLDAPGPAALRARSEPRSHGSGRWRVYRVDNDIGDAVQHAMTLAPPVCGTNGADQESAE